MPAEDPVGYAVVGLGWISQSAMLPAFANASESSRLSALVSGSDEKRQRLARRYGLESSDTYDYDDFDACLDRPDVQAVYIAVPNHLHREYTVRAAEKGVHVLCEKPMAPSVEDCRAMIDACRENDVRLMIAYRLHLEPAHLRAVELVRSGDIGDPRVFDATFTQQVKEDDIRLVPQEKGGGAVYDIGVYCINAARYLFGAEPLRVSAMAVSTADPRFEDIEEAVSCVLTFPDERLASFTCSFGAAAVASFRLVGTESDLVIYEDAFEFRGNRQLVIGGGEDGREPFPESDQFAAQLAYFSDCVREGREPEPDGEEGLIDVTIIRAVYDALASGTTVEIDVTARERRPDPGAAIRFPATAEPEMIGISGPGG